MTKKLSAPKTNLKQIIILQIQDLSTSFMVMGHFVPKHMNLHFDYYSE